MPKRKTKKQQAKEDKIILNLITGILMVAVFAFVLIAGVIIG